MGKSEKIEGFRLTLTTALAVFGGKAAELNQPSFIVVKFQAEFDHSLPQFYLETHGIRLVLEPQDKVSRPRELPPQPLSEPGVNLSAHRAPIIQPPVLYPSSSGGTARVAFGQFYPAIAPLYVDGLLTS